MERSLRVVYLGANGFAVSAGDTLLVIDDVNGVSAPGEGIRQGKVTERLISRFRHTVFLVTGGLPEHFNEAVCRFAETETVSYVIADELPEGVPGRRMRRGDLCLEGDAEIAAYGATGSGVSYLIKTAGWRIFCAGELNFWHWRERSTLREIGQAERDYEQAVRELYGKEIDLAFFPLDPRMGEYCDAGIQHFLMNVKPKALAPTHWQGRTDVLEEFARRNHSRTTGVLGLTRPGAATELIRDENGRILFEEAPLWEEAEPEDAEQADRTSAPPENGDTVPDGTAPEEEQENDPQNG